jgi:hypothetical protein
VRLPWKTTLLFTFQWKIQRLWRLNGFISLCLWNARCKF